MACVLQYIDYLDTPKKNINNVILGPRKPGIKRGWRGLWQRKDEQDKNENVQEGQTQRDGLDTSEAELEPQTDVTSSGISGRKDQEISVEEQDTTQDLDLDANEVHVRLFLFF